MSTQRLLTGIAASCCLACSGGGGTVPDVDGPEVTTIDDDPPDFSGLNLPFQPIVPLHEVTLPTYDGSGQGVHPDLVFFPNGWHGWEYWMAVTPYPGGDPHFENPSIVVSHDGDEWQTPAGVANPLIPALPVGYNSDPDLTYDSGTDRLVLIYREVAGLNDVVKSLTSADGISWTAPRIVFSRPLRAMISPTIAVRPGNGVAVWYVDATNGCDLHKTTVMRQTTTSLAAVSAANADSGWSSAAAVKINQPGYSIWHIDVTWVAERNEYWAVYPAYISSKCGGDDLFFARSADGITWTTYNVPFIHRGEAPWIVGTAYRASVRYDAPRHGLQVYLSAAGDKPEYAWHVGVVEFDANDFLQVLEQATPAPVIAGQRARATQGHFINRDP